MSGPIPARWAPYLKSVLRIVVAFLFVAHGSQKFFGFPAAEARAGVPLMSLLGLASMIEMIGGTLMFLGLLTRPVAFVLAGEMAVAYFTGHAWIGERLVETEALVNEFHDSNPYVGGRLRLPACHVLRERDRALAHERARHWMGTHAVARDAAGGVGGATTGQPRWLGGAPFVIPDLETSV